jgi:hypothetical protein
MPLALSMNPEDVYEDVSSRADAYGDLSRKLAASGDGYGAGLSIVASDMCHVQALLWQKALVASSDPDQQYAAVLASLDTALSNWVQQNPDDAPTLNAIDGLRSSLRSEFDEPVWGLLSRRLEPLDHLDGVPAPTAEMVADRRSRMLGTSVLHEAPNQKVAIARDGHAAAAALLDSGRTDDAVQTTYRADLASFEAYLLHQAASAGDEQLASAEVLWLLACDALGRLGALSADLATASATVRSVLRQVVGIAASNRLETWFVPVQINPVNLAALAPTADLAD